MAAMWETWVQSLGWEDPLEEVMAIHSSILAWRIPMGRGVWQATVHGVTKSWTQLSDLHSLSVRVSWQKASVRIIFTFILNNTFSKH